MLDREDVPVGRADRKRRFVDDQVAAELGGLADGAEWVELEDDPAPRRIQRLLSVGVEDRTP